MATITVIELNPYRRPGQSAKDYYLNKRIVWQLRAEEKKKKNERYQQREKFFTDLSNRISENQMYPDENPNYNNWRDTYYNERNPEPLVSVLKYYDPIQVTTTNSSTYNSQYVEMSVDNRW